MDNFKIRIRQAQEKDLPAIVAMLADDPLGKNRENVGPELNPAYSKAFDEILADPNALILLATNAGKPLACLQINILANLTLTGTKRGLIEGVRVQKEARGQGIGAQLFKAAIAHCRQRGCGLVQLTTNTARPGAARFYEKLGFIASHTGYKLPL